MPRSGVRGFRADRLRELRLRAGLSVDDLAAKIGVSRQAVSTWEVGRSTPPPGVLAKIADALDVAIAALVPIPESQLRLADLRVLAALTQSEAATLLGMSPTVLGDVERGAKKVAQDRASALSALYGVPVDVVVSAWERTIRIRQTRAKLL